MRRMILIAMAALSLSVAVPASIGETASATAKLLIGTWKYEAVGSRFVGRAPYRSAIIIFAEEKGGIRTVEEVVTANGAKFRIEYLDPQDGTFVPVHGNPYYDSEATTWTGPRTATRKERRAGKDTGTTIMTVAPDGRSFTADANRFVPEGRLYQAFVVWRRVDP